MKTKLKETKYKDAVDQFNSELIKHPSVIKAAKRYGKNPAEIVKALQMRLSTKGDRGGDTKEVSIDFKDNDSDVFIKHKKKFESVNEVLTRSDLSFMDRLIREWSDAVHDMNWHIRLYSDTDYAKWARDGYLEKLEAANKKRIEVQDSLLNQIYKLTKIKLDK